MKKKKWKEILDLGKGITAVYNKKKKQLMIRQDPDLITVIPKNLEEEVLRWLFNKEIKEGSGKLLEWLLNREYYREEKIKGI